MAQRQSDPAERPEFAVEHESPPAKTLLVGISSPGLAGLTAVDYLVDHLELEQTGHVSAEGFPAITPFENGTPRHHTRLFSKPGFEFTVLTGELFVPVGAAATFSDAVFDWLAANGVDEIVSLSGVPVPHGPEQHKPFYIATNDYQRRRLGDADLEGMGAGFLDGVNAEFLARGIDSPLAAGVFVTPVHAQMPDVEAAIRLLEAVEAVYDVPVDTGPLEEFAGEVEQYYRDLAERIEAATREEVPEDRMYM